MNKKTTTATATAIVRVKKIGIMTISARAASKEIGAADSRFCAAIYMTDDTRKTAGEYLANKIVELVKGGNRARALEIARLTRPFTRRTAAILAARDIAAAILAARDIVVSNDFKLADTIAAEIAAAEVAERPYIEREAERARIRAEKAAAKKAEREAAKIAAVEEKILAAAAEIQAKREAAAKAAA